MATTIEKYLTEIIGATQETGIYAYRGQSDSHWALHSSATVRLMDQYGDDILLDPDFQELYINYHVETLIEPARALGFGSESGRRLSDLELLAKLQHFGARTGLLDFTRNPLVALWFACERPETDGKLVVVNTNDPMGISRISSEEAVQDVRNVFSRPPRLPHSSYWETPASGDASTRILPQRSVFVIGRPLILIEHDVITEILVTKEDKEQLQIELETLDVHQESLFQDIYGFAQGSRRRPVPRLTSGAYTRRGNQHYQRGEYGEAAVAYANALQLEPEASLVYLSSGNAYAASGHHLEAIADYDRAITYIDRLYSVPRDVVYFNRGNSKADLPDYEGAIQDYTEAIRINSDSPHYYYNRGNAYADLYKFDEALLDYDQVAGGESSHAIFNKGNALLAMGRLSEAKLCYEQAIQSGISHVGLHQNTCTLDKMVPLIDGLNYGLSAELDPGTGTMCLRFTLPETATEVGREIERSIFFGRAGNVGNTGGPGLSGGLGFQGKPFVRVCAEFRSEHGT